MTLVVPTIHPSSWENLQEQVSKVCRFVPRIQIDVYNGTFTHSSKSTWPFSNDRGQFTALAHGDEGLPYWQDVSYEVDLLVQEPEQYIDEWIAAGVEEIIIHVETVNNISSILKKGKENGVGIALAINPSTDVNILIPWIHEASFIQIMGSDTLGLQGISFSEEALKKTTYLRELAPEAIISFDIGVTEETASRIVAAGANKLISGSAIFSSSDIKGTIQFLENIK